MTKSARIFCSIAAICYIIYVAFCAGDYWFKLYYSTAVGSILVPLIAVATAVTLLVKNKKAVIVVMGINAIFYGYCVVRDLILRASLDNIIDGVNIAAAYFGLFALVILSLKGNAIVRKIWFVPAAVSLLGVAILAVGYWQHVRTWAGIGIEAHMQIIGVHLLSDLIIVVAQFFVGMWLKKDTVVTKTAYYSTSSVSNFSLTAVVCYAVCAAYILCVGLRHWSIGISLVLGIVGMAAMAIAVFMKNTKVLMAATVINAIFGTCYCIIGRYCDYNDYLYETYRFYRYYLCHHYVDGCNIFGGICNCLAYLGVFALIMLSLKGKAIVKTIWFAPASAMFLGYAVNWMNYLLNLNFLLKLNFLDVWCDMLFNIVEIVALLFVGMWLKKSTVVKKATLTVVNSTSAPAIIGGADKLKMYKELLESGSITQAEFDEKKKQILGL